MNTSAEKILKPKDGEKIKAISVELYEKKVKS